MSGCPTLDISVHQIHTRALLDTGSTRSFISRSFFDFLSHKFPSITTTPTSMSCLMANSSALPVTHSTRLPVKFSNFSWPFEFAIVDNLTFQIVLGMDFITSTGLIMDFSRSNFYFKFAPLQSFSILNLSPLYCSSITTSDSNWLPSLAHLPPDKVTKLLPVLQDFSDVLTPKLGLTNQGSCTLELLDNTPCRTPPYIVAPPKLQILRQHIDELLTKQIIVPTTSEYASPCFLIPKKDGGHRLVVDYRKLNAKIKFDTFPLPTIESALMHFGGAKFFTVLDLNSAYHQIPLSPESQPLTAFSTQFGTFAYTRLPFGLAVGGQILSRILSNIFNDISWNNLFLYLDDLLVYSDTFEQHLEHLSLVLSRLRASGFTVKPEKIKICVKEISYLGYLISGEGVRVNPERILPIVDFPRPHTLRQLRRFLGMCGFYARFIPHMSCITEPLNSLKRKGVKFKWGSSQQEAFDKLKFLLTHPPVLHAPDFCKPFILQTDASSLALGAVLQQVVDDHPVPIAYASRRLTSAEIHTSIYEKECLAAIWACEKFSKYLEHQHFTLQTDNQALTWLKAQPHSLGKIGRWIYRLSAFSFNVEHIPSKDNPVADGLSRLFEDEEIPTDSCAILVDYPLSFQSINDHQREDEWCKKLINRLEIGQVIPNYQMHQRLLIYKPPSTAKKRVVVPAALTSMITKYFHDSVLGGHLGVAKTIHKISTHFYWPQMTKSIAKFVRCCEPCQRAKPSSSSPTGFHTALPSERPWQNIHIDHVGPLPRSTQGNIGIFSLIDSFSKFTLLFPVKRISADITISLLINYVFCLFGPPSTIVSDNHSIFVSRAFKKLCFEWGIRHSRTSPYRPHSSHIERFHRNLRSSLIIFSHENHSSWDYFVPFIQSAYNSAWHTSSNSSPNSLFLGRDIPHPLMLAWNFNLDDDAFQNAELMEEKWTNALRSLKAANLRSAQYYNKNRKPCSLKVDDWVLLRAHPSSSAAAGISAKLLERWNGPYVILKFITPVTVLLRLPLGSVAVRQAHVTQLKPFVSS